MHWHGEGTAKDPVQAYIWADLAAERSNSRDLLEIREKIWGTLSPEQQRQARERGPDYAARYGDCATLVRTNSHIRHFARNQSGSRAGAHTMNLGINLGRPDVWLNGGKAFYSARAVTEESFYGNHRTKPAQY